MDHSTGYIYWVDDSLDIVARIHLDGGESQVIRYGSRYPTPYGITVFGDYIIWVDRNLKKVFQASKEPGNTDPPVVIRDNINLLRDVTVFDERAQPLSAADLDNNPCLQGNGGCAHFCFAQPELSTPKCGCAFGALGDDGKSCATSREDFLIYTLNNSVRSLHFDPEDHSPPFQEINVRRTAIALDYDHRNNRIFFTQKLSSVRGQISYVSLYSGTNSPVVLLSGKRTPGGVHLGSRYKEVSILSIFNALGESSIFVWLYICISPCLCPDIGICDGIAFDWINRRIYYSDYTNQTINSVAEDGSKRAVIARVSKPRAIVLDPCRGYDVVFFICGQISKGFRVVN